MKWPSSLTLVRHAESEYNALKEEKKKIPEWKPFTKLFDKGQQSDTFIDDVLENRWPSPELVQLAESIHRQIRESFGPFSDFTTPITENGRWQAMQTGKALREMTEKAPDVVYISPYLRTRQTYEEILSQWPALRDAPVVEEERIREQEHGLSTLYNDWRIFSVKHPEQAALHKQMGPYYWRHPQGESVCDVRERGRDFLGMLTREHANEDVFAVTHHLTILSTRANLERWGQAEFIDEDENRKPFNCGVTIYKGKPEEGKNGRLVRKEYNTKHY